MDFQIVDKPKLALTDRLQKTYDGVDSRIAVHDHMNVVKDVRHYFSVGASALSIIDLVCSTVRAPPPRSVLDFASGAGRVTRWLKSGFPDARIVSADVREDDLQFQRSVLQVGTWKSESGFGLLQPPGSFDLIWVGSLLTHLPEADARQAVEAFMQWLTPAGLLIVTFHGRRVRLGQMMRNARYISDSKFRQVEQDYLDKGYGYADYDGQTGLGFSLTKPHWFFDLIAPKVQWTLVSVLESAWDNHHDVCAIRNAPVCVPTAGDRR